MEKELEKIYTEARRKSDEELLAGDAGVVSTGKQIILNPTEEQTEKIKDNYEQKKKIIEQEIEIARINTINKYNRFSKMPVIDEGYLQEQINNILRQKLLYHLKKTGVIVEIDGIEVCDVSKFVELNQESWFTGQIRYKEKKKNITHQMTKKMTISLLGDMPVISIEDYKKQRLEGIIPNKMHKKPFFNVPHTLKDITDIKTIKNKEYYLNYWDIYPRQIIDRQTKFPIENEDEINLLELYIAVKIFRDFKGYRNKQGELIIFNPQKQKFEKITADIMRKLKIFKTYNLGIQQTLTKYGPHLLKSGLLKRNDFMEYTNQDKNNNIILRIERMPNFPNRFKPGFDSVTYYLGRKYFIFDKQRILMKDIKAVDLDPNCMGIVRLADGREELIYKISKVKENEKEDLVRRGASKIKYGKVIELGKKLVEERIEKYQIADIIPRGISESAEEYAERLKKLPNYKEVNTVTNELSTKTGVGIHNLPWREQIQIAQMSFESSFDENKKKRFIDFVKNYGLTGLRAFLSLEQGGLEMGEKILLIGERFREENKEIADGIFAKYAELVDTVYEIENYLKEQFEKEDPQLAQKVQEELLLTGKAVLKMFADKKMTAETARQRLEEINIQTNCFAVTIQNLSREDIASLNLTRAKDSTLDIISNPAELLEDKNKKILNQILELVVDKFPGENEKSAFLADLQNDNTESVVISRLEKEVLSFFMKKKTTKGLYEIDWVTANSNSSAKGLGEATLVSGFKETYQGGEEYRAVAKPFVKTFRIFIEKLGFVAHQGITADGEYAHHYAKMRRLQTDQNYSSKNFSPEQSQEFINILKHNIQQSNTLQKITFAGNTYQVAKIVFENIDYKQDIQKEDSDGFIYKLIERQDTQEKVLTRFIPDSYAKDNRVFYAVFE